MKAAFYCGPGVLKVEEVETPRIAEDELLLRVKAAAICGTDLRILKHGHFKIPAGQRRVLGHEIAGEIVEVGKLTQGFRVGMRVTATPNIGCGVCEYCREGFNNMCQSYEAFGISIDGAFQEYMKVPAVAIGGRNVFVIPDQVSYEEAALTEPLSCCYNGLRSVSTTHADTVLVIGAGPIGCMHVMLSRVAGAKRILAADIRKDRLEKIAGFGADGTIDLSVTDMAQAVMEDTSGRGVDIIIATVAVASVLTQSLRVLATPGRVNFFAGFGKDGMVPIDVNRLHYHGLRIVGTTGSSNLDYFKCVGLVAEKRVNLRSLVSNTFPLADISAAFEYAASGRGLKTMVQG
ncbi:MAG TPA: zinc-dependent dehydrogenase [Anaeromyxobacteraceae bacterium]|nr:zinc-dependent dehydrogenase [Anaeromyxobacteraceae bacterium]